MHYVCHDNSYPGGYINDHMTTSHDYWRKSVTAILKSSNFTSSWLWNCLCLTRSKCDIIVSTFLIKRKRNSRLSTYTSKTIWNNSLFSNQLFVRLDYGMSFRGHFREHTSEFWGHYPVYGQLDHLSWTLNYTLTIVLVIKGVEIKGH